MALQNRVDPFGEIHANDARGLFMGNRGIIHDPSTRMLLARRWTTKAWIVCVCEFRGRKRTPMGGRSWTELFFLDEVTALAAGHRPCFYCQRGRATDFAQRFRAANRLTGKGIAPIDLTLHGERLASARRPLNRTDVDVETLPDGAMISIAGKAFAIHAGKTLPWSFHGYGPAQKLPGSGDGTVSMITPPSTVATLQGGFLPIWHDSVLA